MDKSNRKWILCILGIIVVIAIGIAIQEKSSREKTIQIGVLFPLTGDAASYGEKGQKAIELAITEISSAGGIQGKQVKAIFEDSRAEPKTGVVAIQKLISVDHVPAVIGDIVSAVTLPAASIAEKNKVILLSPTSSAPAITEAGDYIYRIWPSDFAEGSAIAEYAYQKGYRSVAILHLNNDYGVAISNVFIKTFEKTDSKIVLNEGYLENNTDFRTVLSKVNNAKPDAVYIAGYYADTSRIVKQGRELGIQLQFFGTTAIEDSKFLELAGNAAEGIIYPLATGFDANLQNTITKNFVDSFKKRFNYEPGWVEAQSYDAMMLICKAISNIQLPVTGTKIKDYFDLMGEYHGCTGKIVFDENGDVIKPVSFKVIKSGEFKFLPD